MDTSFHPFTATTTRRCLFILCLICTPFFNILATAQQYPHYFTEKLGTSNGLSSNNINDIVQDDDGYLWIATPEGLNRYDGTETTPFYHSSNAGSLPHNYVYCLKKLTGHYLAVGTQGGLGFYNCDSGLFHNFYYSQSNVLDEFDNIITSMETDVRGNLWAISKNCVFIFDTLRRLKNLIRSPFTAADLARQRPQFAEKIFPLQNGDVLLYLYDGWHRYDHLSSRLGPVSNPLLLSLLHSVSPPVLSRYFTATHLFSVFGKYLICIPAHEHSLLLFDDQGHKLGSCPFPYNTYPRILWAQKIAVADSSTLVILFQSGGFAVIRIKWTADTPSLETVSAPQSDDSRYNKFLVDTQGNWWLATNDDGLHKIAPSRQYFRNFTLLDKVSHQPVNCETVGCSRYKHTVWAATYGAGFFQTDLFSGKQEQHRFFHTSDDTWSNYVWNVRQVNKDTVWVGTQNGLFWYVVNSKKYGRIPAFPGKPAAIDSVPITTQFTDSHGMVWIGLGKGRGLCCFDPAAGRFFYYPGNVPGGYPLRYPTNIVENKKGDLWFASDGSTSLVCWNRNSNSFRTIPLPAGREHQIGNLYGIWMEADSVLWLGSITCGLIKYNIAKASICIYNHEQGLNNSHISSLFEDKKKRLWLITEGGLSCFNPLTTTFINYTPEDGLPVKYPTDFFYYDTLDKRLYAGGKGAFFYFSPDSTDFSVSPSAMRVTSLQVNGQPFALYRGSDLQFSPHENNISIHYASIDLTNGPSSQYAYRLFGGDSAWIMTGGQRQINFSQLAPGKYKFVVASVGNNGLPGGQMTSLAFTISTPFSQTSWFYLMVLACLAGIFYIIYRFRLRQLQQTEQIRAGISENLHDEVGVNLTNISLSSLLAQQQLHNEKGVSRLLDRIYQDSQTVSVALREIVWSVNPGIDTIGQALPRMLQYAAELLETNNMSLQAEIDPEVEKLKLSMKARRDLYLIFKEGINNIARHSMASVASIHFYLQKKALILIMKDNGTGFNVQAPRSNNGLKNMEERARRNKWQLQVNSDTGKGTSIRLHARIA